MHVSLLLTAFLLYSALLAPLSAFATDRVLRFDMGTADSPVARGFQPVTEATAYTADRGYGWVGTNADRQAFHRTAISEAVRWQHPPGAELVDGVASSTDLVFQVDVPNGSYTVEIQLGDVGGEIPPGMGRFLDTGVRGEVSGGPGGPLFSMAVDANKRPVAKDIATRTFPHRGSLGIPQLLKDLGIPADKALIFLGNHVVVRFDEQVRDGRLVLRFHGDETTYRTALPRLKGITDSRVQRQSLYIAGGPFTKNSVLSVVVRPAVPAPFESQGGTLNRAAGGHASLDPFIAAFNAGQWEKAAREIESLPGQTFADQEARILARMWLAGHPDVLKERELLPVIAADIEQALSAKDRDPAQLAELRSLKDRLTDMQQGIRNYDQRTQAGQQVVTSMNRAEGYFARALPGDPFYWKSQLYRARIWYSMDPVRNANLWRRSEDIMRQMEEVFPNNRWVRFYRHHDSSGWSVADSRPKTQNAPAWASEVHNFYNRIIDLGEWWVANRQNPDNASLGGEWGDDVELMPLFAYTSVICPDASPRLIEGAMKFADGAWHQSGIVDVHNGFFHITSDAEHAAEFTGNVLGMMLQAKPGDPEYVERCLKTGKLMRDLWTGRNSRGQRLMRSSFIGAFNVVNEPGEIDSAICGRALNPAWNIWELNHNPELARLAVEYADTLLALAMTTQKGKPRGVIPGPIVFETGELGTLGSSDWWLAPPGSFQGMFSFPDYHGFRSQILTLAWRITDNEKYLEPIKLEAEFVEQHYPVSEREHDRQQRAQLAKGSPEKLTEYHVREQEYRGGREAGSAPWTARMLAPLGVIETWADLQLELRGGDPETQGVLLNKDEVAREAHSLMDVARNRWPMMTDDATMTDRALFGKCYASSIWYSGTEVVAQQFQPALSFEGPGRDFAALVLRHNPRFIKLLYYGFQDAPRDVTLRFWELEPQGTYRLVGGPDDNGDDKPDELTFDEEFKLVEPSGGLTVKLPPDRTFVFEVRQTARGQSTVQVADPAIAARDVRFDPRGYLLVDVHNIGNMPAADVEVTFYQGDPDQGGKRLGRTIVSYVEPPNALEPQIVRTGIEWTPTEDQTRVTVVLDESNRLTELFERNNRASTVIERAQPSDRP